jgi:hypothetical protein
MAQLSGDRHVFAKYFVNMVQASACRQPILEEA